MKNTLKKLVFLTVFVLSSLIVCAEDYMFMALGDIHYLGKEYCQTADAVKKRKKKLNMWKNGKSDILLAEAGKVAGNNMLFAVQLGDLCDGGTYSFKMHKKMLVNAFRRVKKYFPDTPLTAVKGNHDNYKGQTKAWCNSILPLMSAELKEEVKSVNYSRRVGDDLYIYYDGQNTAESGIAFVKKTLEENKNIRYLFFFTHLPVIPIGLKRVAWICAGQKELVDLLSAHNAIILCAHTHTVSYAAMNTAYGSITQMSIYSVGYGWRPGSSITARCKNFDEYVAYPGKIEYGKLYSLKELFENMKNYTFDEYNIYHAGSCFALIRVNEKSVEADLYFDLSGKPFMTKTLRRLNK